MIELTWGGGEKSPFIFSETLILNSLGELSFTPTYSMASYFSMYDGILEELKVSG